MKKPRLSRRETEILNLIMKENTSREMANKLNVSIRTIETIRKKIMLKTNTPNIVALAKFALKNKLT